VQGKIISLAAAEPGWRAIYLGEDAEDTELARVVAWALVEGDDRARAVIGMVIDTPTRLESSPHPMGRRRSLPRSIVTASRSGDRRVPWLRPKRQTMYE
jgi:hypothetical protein